MRYDGYDKIRKKDSKAGYIIMIISSIISISLGTTSIIRLNNYENNEEIKTDKYYEWKLDNPLYIGTDDEINWHITNEYGSYNIIRKVDSISNVVDNSVLDGYEIINLSGIKLSIPKENSFKLKR